MDAAAFGNLGLGGDARRADDGGRVGRLVGRALRARHSPRVPAATGSECDWARGERACGAKVTLWLRPLAGCSPVDRLCPVSARCAPAGAALPADSGCPEAGSLPIATQRRDPPSAMPLWPKLLSVSPGLPSTEPWDGPSWSTTELTDCVETESVGGSRFV